MRTVLITLIGLNGLEHAGSWAVREGGNLVKTGKHVVHDLEPWHW